jgi:hydroxymethylglutaryl-CoA lyase
MSPNQKGTFMTESVLVREVGLRDGLQIIGAFMPTAEKKEWIDRCAAVGIREIEATSFVPEKYLPQFRDAAEIVAHCSGRPGFTVAALVPNLQGAQRALAAGADKLVCLLSATEGFSAANLRRSKQRSLAELKEIIALRDRLVADGARRASIQAGISVAFGCPFEGRVADQDVCATALAAAALGADEIALADTAGQGDPAQVRRVFRALHSELPQHVFAAHFHDTRGTGLANVLAALDAGVRAFDASLAGLGGCPNSPGATGNIATEDLVFMLEAMGLDTQIDVAGLLEIRAFLAQRLPGVRMFGHIGAVGFPKGFVPARGRSRQAEQGS